MLRTYHGLGVKDLDDMELDRFMALLPDPKEWDRGVQVNSLDDILAME